ncbi:four-helix bundle copper-binding protein [Deinococcus aestuarii]|uniref:four-helix bundle copper-binding protein n=1 Tax=Deinococcus aestuarii TaxID=2774531 RepID=UPI001C0DD67F|nr:four-helix bundle copper-binding protein [Deinococcus aestuarii]
MPQNTARMLQTHPNPASVFDQGALADCIDACFECENICTSCADACLGEQGHLMHLVHCIRLNLDCADICGTTGRVLSRLTQPDQNVLRAQLQACLAACQACGNECEMHARDMNMQHCAVCAESCRRCEQACQQLLGSMSA